MRHSKRTCAAALLALVLAAGLSDASVSTLAHADPGDPVIPGQDQIDKANADANASKSASDGIQASLDAADRQLHVLEGRAGQAVEAYDTAAAQSALATKAAAATQVQLALARAAKAEADRRLGVFASESYRTGPDLSSITSLMHAGSLRQLTDGEQALREVANLEANALEDAQAAEHAADDAQRKAAVAAAQQQAAAAAAATARDTAQAAAGNEQGEVARISAQREVLLAQLAQAQGIAVGLERQREEGLQIQAARAAETAREAAQTRQSGLKDWGPMPNAAGSVKVMLDYIYAQLGKPYVWGGAGPDVFDCSGLAMRGLEAAGWDFPHPAQWQYLAMHPVSYSQLRPGDLVFWADDDSNPHTIYHEAIYIGDDRIIQAPRPGGVVEIQSLWVNGRPSFYGRP
jgi:peptidoglycan DL-endopeptidase CwlO